MQRQRVDVIITLDGVHGVELNIKEEEDESIKSWAQTITQTSDSCNHPLDHTCKWRWQLVIPDAETFSQPLTSELPALSEM